MVSRDQIDLEDLTTSSLPCHRVPYPAAKFSGTGLRSCQTSAVEGDGGYPSLPRERTTPGHRLLCRLGSESEPGGIDGTTYLDSHLPADGTPDGTRIIEKSNWTGRASRRQPRILP